MEFEYHSCEQRETEVVALKGWVLHLKAKVKEMKMGAAVAPQQWTEPSNLLWRARRVAKWVED